MNEFPEQTKEDALLRMHDHFINSLDGNGYQKWIKSMSDADCETLLGLIQARKVASYE